MLDPEIVAHMKSRIIEEIEKGRSLSGILNEDEDLEFPSSSLVYQWLSDKHKQFDPVFVENYAHASERRAELLFEEILTIADTPMLGQISRETKDKAGKTTGKETTTSDMIQHRRLQVDARKWHLSKVMPKKYGQKIETTIEGGEKPLTVIDYSKFSTGALEEFAKFADAGKPKP